MCEMASRIRITAQCWAAKASTDKETYGGLHSPQPDGSIGCLSRVTA
jgi:hypothetical protein